jgi:TrpR-related protein YerC/YecD
MYESKLKSDALDQLFDAILSLKNREECYMLFDDLCTVSELNAVGLRYEVARLLDERNTCNAIAAKTGASTATISRVNRCLRYGSGGYRLAIDRRNEGK